MDKFIFFIVGILLLAIGVINITGNISTIHSYNRKKVKEEDAPKYGRAVGIGTVIVGAGLISRFIFELFELARVGVCVMIPFIGVGIAFILYAQFKYNKGIF